MFITKSVNINIDIDDPMESETIIVIIIIQFFLTYFLGEESSLWYD